MRFYTGAHPRFGGIDLSAKQRYTGIMDTNGNKRLRRDLKTETQAFLKAIAPYREDRGVSAERLVSWRWLSDRRQKEHLPFVLGHALFMRAARGVKHTNEKIEAEKIARRLTGGARPMA